jgi:CheY-like chemotaxis protein
MLFNRSSTLFAIVSTIEVPTDTKKVTAMPDQPLVLIVDDEPSVHQVLARVFRGLGFATAFAQDNTEALAQALRLHPQLITTDMGRAGGSGLRLIEQIRASESIHHIPIVMISGSASEADRRQAETFGSTVTMWKPFKPSEIATTVERVFPRDQWCNPELPSNANVKIRFSGI